MVAEYHLAVGGNEVNIVRSSFEGTGAQERA